MPNYELLDQYPLIGSAPFSDLARAAAVEFKSGLGVCQNGNYQAAAQAFLAAAELWLQAQDPGYQVVLKQNRILAYKNAVYAICQCGEFEMLSALLAEINNNDKDCSTEMATFCKGITKGQTEPGDKSDD